MAIQTATNPETGERIALINGRWMPFTQSATNDSGQKAFLVGGKWVADGAAQKEKPAEESGVLRQAADVPVSVARGATMGVRMIADAFGANNPVSNTIKGVEDYLGGLMSAQSKNDEQEIARIMKDAEDKGFLDQVKAGFQAFATAPVDLLAQGLGTAAPAILGALGGKVLGAGVLATRAVGAGVGAGMGSGAIKGGIYEEVKEALADTGMSPEQVEARAQLAQSYGGENLDMILAGAALGGLASATGIEPILARQAARNIVGRTMAGRAATTAVAEAAPEIVQGSQEQLAQNLALQREGFDVDTFRGVAGAGTLEGLAGAGLGAVVGAAQRPEPTAETGAPTPEDLPPSTPDDLATLPEEGDLEAPAPRAKVATLPDDRFSDADVIATGVDIPPASLPLIRRLTVGKTREELQDFVAENPEYLENESPSSRVIRSLISGPARQPDQLGMEPPVPPVGRAEQPDTGAVVPPERTGLDVAGPVTGPAAIPARAPTPAITETPIGITTPQAIEAETQEPQGPAELAGPVIEDVAVPVAPSDSWNGMDEKVRLQVAKAAGLPKPVNFSNKNWNSLSKDVRSKLSNVLATQEASTAPPAGEGRVLSIEEQETASQIADLEKQRRKIERSGESLFGKLRRIGMREEDLKEVFGRKIPVSAQSLRYKDRPGTSIATLVSNGTLDAWLPYDKRLGAANFDPQEAEQIIIDRLGEKRYLTEDTEMDMRRLGLYIDDLEQALKLEDINAELELAAQEQRSLDQEAETAAPSEEDRGAGRAEEAQAPAAPEPELKPAAPEAPSFPRVDSIESFSMGPGGTMKPKVIAGGKPLYRETNVEGLNDLLGHDKQFEYSRNFVADNPEIAIGQGMNTGVKLVFRPDSLSGKESAKPGTGDLAGREYTTDIIAPRAIQSITMSAKAVNQTRPFVRRILNSEFDKTDLGDGRVLFTRKGLEAAPDLTLTPATPDTQAEAERRAKEAEQKAAQEAKAAEEAEAKAQKERERKEIEDRSKGAAEDFQLGQTAEENLTGQKDIFAQPPELQISPEKEKEQALKLFSSRLALTTSPFKAKYANRTALLRPRPLSEKQKAQLEELASKAIDLGLPASTLNLVTDFGATSMSGAAAMSESGSFLLSKEWASASESDKLHSFVHELAHAIDFQIAPRLTNGKRFSAEAKWSAAHDELKGWYDKNPFLNPLAYPFATRYAGKTNLKMESFAQAAALYITNPVRLKNNAPQAYSQIQTIVEGIQNESKATSAAGAAKTSPSGVNVRQARTEKDSGVQPAAGKVGNGVGQAARGEDRAADQVTGDTIEVDGKERPTRDADGRLIESTPEKLRNFWRWVGSLPLHSSYENRSSDRGVYKLYHMTTADFNKFIPGGLSPMDSGPAIFLSTDPAAGSATFRVGSEERGFREGARTMPVYAKLKNPLVIDSKEMLSFARESFADGSREFPQLISKETVDALKAEGYDSVIFDGKGAFKGGAPNEIIVFDPKQIKSATGNVGTYGDVEEINLMESPVQDPDALKGEGKKAVENSRESILYQPIDGTWNTPMDPKPLKLSDEFFYNWVDKQVDLKRVVDAIKATGKRVAGKFNALERERTYHGRVAKRTQDYLTNELQPTIELMKKYGITQREMGEYLLNRHAPEANRVIAERNPRFPDAGSSVKTEDAIKYMENLDPLRKRQLDAVAKRMDKTLAKMQDMLVKNGIETQDTIDGWRDMFQHYIPLVRDDADYSINKVMSQGAGYSRSGQTAKSRTGSAKEVNLDEIFSNIAMQHERMIVRAEGNRVGNAVFGLALTQPNPGFWLALDPETNVIWKTIKELEQIKADRDLLKEMLESGELSPSQEAAYRMELDLIRKIIKKKEQPARSAFAKARDDLMELKFSPEEATKLVEQLMMPPMKARYNKDKNEVVYEPNAAVNNEFVFATRVNGSDKFVLFNGNDERANRMVRGLKNMDAENLSEAMNIAAKITRFFAAINTQYNPVFGAYNFLRDVQTAALQISTTDIADKRKEVINGTPAALKAIFQVARARRDGKTPKGKLAEAFEEFENEGGQTGFRDQFSQSAERAEAIQRMIDPSSWASSPLGKFFTAGGKLKVPMETMRKGAAPLFDFLSDYNQALENSVRLSAYIVARDKFINEGMSPDDAKQKAAVTAKEITVNFNQKGVKATQIGALYAFFNASVQGTTMMARTLAGPIGRKIIAGGMLWGVIQTLMLAAAGFDDEEPPEFVKQRNFIIPYGDGKYLAFPMPLGFNVIPTISRLATEAVVSGGENTSGKVVSLLDALMDMFNPIGNAGMSFQTITPTLLDPLAALFENKSWTGQSIAREDFSALNPTPGFTRSRDSSNAISQEVARLLNYMSGGNEDRKGIISPTADQLEYLVGQLTGGVGRELLKAGKTVESAITGEELPSYSVPLVGRFHGNVNEMAAVSSAFYRNLTELNIQKEEIKTIRDNKGDLQAYFAENPEARLAQMATTQYNQIKNLRKLRQAALEKGDKDRAKTLEEAIKKRMINLNERYEKMTD
jgi:hypothetical protein